MKYLFVLLTLTGCAYGAASGPESFDASAYEPKCARSCLLGYDSCIAGGSTYNSMAANSAYIACNSNTRQCLSTCPKR